MSQSLGLLGTPATQHTAAPRAVPGLRADAERNRRRILHAAADLFAQRGLDVGLDEIARHAGVGTATVYRRFPDKSMLIDALFEEQIEDAIELASRASQNDDPWAGLVSLIEDLVAMQLANRGLKELLFDEACPPSSFRDRRAEVVPLIESLVERARASGQLRPDFDHTDLVVILLMVNAAGVFTADVGPGRWRRHLGMILDGLRTQRDAPTPLPMAPLDLSDVGRLCGFPSVTAAE